MSCKEFGAANTFGVISIWVLRGMYEVYHRSDIKLEDGRPEVRIVVHYLS